jgi:hypothetical protein
MTKRIKKTIAAVAALGALALGGAVFAQAQSGQGAVAPSVQSASESATVPDTDNIQSGDQTTLDQAGAASSSTASEQASAESEQPDAESAPNSDGPGGHADEPGNAGANYEFQGQQ